MVHGYEYAIEYRITLSSEIEYYDIIPKLEQYFRKPFILNNDRNRNSGNILICFRKMLDIRDDICINFLKNQYINMDFYNYKPEDNYDNYNDNTYTYVFDENLKLIQINDGYTNWRTKTKHSINAQTLWYDVLSVSSSDFPRKPIILNSDEVLEYLRYPEISQFNDNILPELLDQDLIKNNILNSNWYFHMIFY
jgi:hypothetical protein